ncbi:uncharacterized protein TrAtP1_004163 [Trichoderma atroviride]|uniref:uncharacterized protein n=1 Tax=Hypocrea atroviridis TaxID=63577 RepID=UPI003333CD84|nr:hypothetical protein TrAtP1_004163 [Trichoderma atroviride]
MSRQGAPTELCSNVPKHLQLRPGSMLKSANKAPRTSGTAQEDAAEEIVVGRLHPARSSEPQSRYSTSLSILQVLARTSAVSSALAAKLVARVFRAASRVGQGENSPIKPTGGPEPLVCVAASPLAAGTGDAGGSTSSTPSTLRVTAGLVSATVSTAESSTLTTQATLRRFAKLHSRLPASGMPSSLAIIARRIYSRRLGRHSGRVQVLIAR